MQSTLITNMEFDVHVFLQNTNVDIKELFVLRPFIFTNLDNVIFMVNLTNLECFIVLSTGNGFFSAVFVCS